MFDYFPQPWIGSQVRVMVHFLNVESRKIILPSTYGELIHESLYFSSQSVELKVQRNQKNKKKYVYSVRFPLKYIKYYQLEEFYEHESDLLPQWYKLDFYVDITSEVEEKELSEAIL